MTNELKEIFVSALVESPTNPRRSHDAKAHAELVESVREKGIITPLLVRPNGGAGKYEIVAGHRRARAAKEAGLGYVPAIVRDLSDQDALEIQVIENLQRADVHPLDEAEGYARLMKTCGYGIDDLAAKIGKSKSYVYQRLKLADLIEPAKKAFSDDKIAAGHAILIARLQPADQAEALDECTGPQLLSVRDLTEWIQWQTHRKLSAAPWPKDDPSLLSEAGSCRDCGKRTGNAPELFPEIERKDTCTDPACYRAKLDAHVERTKDLLAREGAVVQISMGWSHGKPKKGAPIPEGQWVEVDKKHSCEHAVKAIVVSRPGREDVDHGAGQIKTVCVEPTCKKHFGRHGASRTIDPTEREEARKREAERETKSRIRAAILSRIAETIAADFAQPPGLKPRELAMLMFVAERFYAEVGSDERRAIASRLGWISPAKGARSARGADSEKLGRKKLGEMTWPAMVRLLVECAVARDFRVSMWSTEKAVPESFRRAADIVLLDADVIAKQIAAEASAKAKDAKKPERTREAAGKPKAAKAVQASARKQKGSK